MDQPLVSPLTEFENEIKFEYDEFVKDYLEDNPPGHLWSFEKYLIYLCYELTQRQKYLEN